MKIGKGKESDIVIHGWLMPHVAVEIKCEDSDYILHRVSGKKKVTINGEEMDEKVLEKEDLIAIVSEEFVFKR